MEECATEGLEGGGAEVLAWERHGFAVAASRCAQSGEGPWEEPEWATAWPEGHGGHGQPGQGDRRGSCRTNSEKG